MQIALAGAAWQSLHFLLYERKNGAAKIPSRQWLSVFATLAIATVPLHLFLSKTQSLAALWVSVWIVPFAYAAHGIWDYAHQVPSSH
jgi:hypothetical protein